MWVDYDDGHTGGYPHECAEPVMREVERRAANWESLHRNTHQTRSHPDCPWCQYRATKETGP